MSLTDAFRKRTTRPADGADPAQAFGAEELTMEEFRRQNFVPPEKKGPGLAARAGAALSGLRSRIVGEEQEEDAFFSSQTTPEAAPEPAPVYSSQNYQSENAPDLGWENPFNDPSPAQKQDAPRRTASRRTQTFQAPQYQPYEYQSEYQPEYQEPAYQTSGYQMPYYQAPNYQPPRQEYGYAPEGYYPENSYPANYAPVEDFYGTEAQYIPPEENWGADPNPPYYDNQYQEPYPEYPNDSTDGGEWYGTDNMPRQRRVSRPKAEPGDFKYMFWAGGIVLSMFLTVFAFIYGCVA